MRHLKPLLFILACLSFTGCILEPETEPKGHLGEGEALPVFSVTTIDGNEVASESFNGKSSVIVFFQTTCKTSGKQLSEVEKLYRRDGNDVNVLAVSAGESNETVRPYMESMGFTMPAAASEDFAVFRLFDRGSVSGIPQTYVTDEWNNVLRFVDKNTVLIETELSRMTDKTVPNDD